MVGMEAKRVMYGTRGMLWLDGDEIAEVESVKATLEADKIEVKMAGHMSSGYKVVGYKGTGSFKVHKVSSYFIQKLAPSIKQGKQVTMSLVSKLDDPDAIGSERVMLKNVIIDSVDLINWELGKLGEEDYKFTFDDYELLDAATA